MQQVESSLNQQEKKTFCENDQLANEAISKEYERAVQLNTTLKAIITWHEEHQ